MRNDGITLLELVVVIAIISILATISLTGLTGIVESEKLKGFAEKMATALNNARFAARKEGKRVCFAIYTNSTSTTNGTYYTFINGTDSNETKLTGEDGISGMQVEIDKDLGKGCENETDEKRCLCFFPVGTPLIGNSDGKIVLKLGDACYKIKVYRIIGLPEVSVCNDE